MAAHAERAIKQDWGDTPETMDRESLERELCERIDEGERLRELARAMADANDTRELLHILAESAADQCGAETATVARVQDGVAELIAAVGLPDTILGIPFPIEHSLTGEAVRSRRTVTHSDFESNWGSEARYKAFRELLEFRVGPLALTPLVTQGEVMGVLCVMRSVGCPAFTIREERRLELLADYASIALKKSRLFEAAQSANQAKSTFLATMSHELRTPLTALTGYGELLADEIVGPLTPLQHDTVERMRAVTHHLTVMIDEILTFSSIEAGREHALTVSVEPKAVLQSVAAVVEPLARKKSILFEVIAEGSVDPIVSDPDKLRQILVNLAGNAVKFTDVGHVRLRVADEGDAVRFAVEDSGIGISEADLARLFQPFTQVDAGLTRRHGGTGLGLYISSRLATLLHGRIDVRSTPGEGSVFSLVIPRLRGELAGK